MKNKFLFFLMSILGMTKLPDAIDDQFEFSEEQKARLRAVDYSEEEIAQLQNDFKKEVSAAQNVKGELDKARAELASLKEDVGLKEDEIVKDGPDRGGGDAANISLSEELKNIRAEVAALKIEKQRLEALDIPKQVEGVKDLHAVKNLVHSATHFLGTGKDWDAIANRPWNAAAVAGNITATTDWGDNLNVATLVKDAEHFWRDNPTEINSLIRDTNTHPSFWPTRYNVSDLIAGASIVTGDVTQARKPLYLPKGKQAIKVEDGKVWPVNIDLTYKGYDLQQMETSWLNAWNREGTSPYKISFIQFLLIEITKKARIEDRIAQIKGIYSAVPEDMAKPGQYVESMDGLLYLLWKAYHVDKKFKTIKRAAPTPTNIVDHVEEVIRENLKEDVINTPNLIYYLSHTHLRWYKIRYREIHGVEMDFNGETGKILEHENIKLCPIVDLEGSNVHFITFDDNIELLENRRGENTLYRFDDLRRDRFIYADYKRGIRMLHIGNKVSDSDPAAFKVQSVWTNGQPFFAPNTTITLYDDTSGIVETRYSDYRVMDKWATTIAEIKGQYPGQIIKLRGNTAALAGATVASNAKISLASTFDLTSGGTLFLKVNSDLTVTEVKRTSAPSIDPEKSVTFQGNSIDSTDGNDFVFDGTNAVSLESILNPTEGTVITITGTGGAALTISDVGGNIDVDGNAVLDTENDSIELTVIDGVFTETARNISE